MNIHRRTMLLAAGALPLAGTLARAGTVSKDAAAVPAGTRPAGSATGMMLDALDSGHFAAPPDKITHEAKRALINWFGCALGASQSDALRRAAESASPGSVPVYGTDLHKAPIDAAFLNCLSSAVYAFDDTHVPTITHPTGPVAAAILSVAQSGHPVSGPRVMEALIAGLELSCALANAFILHSAAPNFGLYLTGVTGPIGAAVAGAVALDLDRQATGWAIGHAATQAAGLRATHGAMSGMVVPAFAARDGLHAALLAQSGFTSTDEVLSGKRGLFAAYTPDADWAAAFAKLGEVYELERVSYKPYPCGVVIHPLLNTIRKSKLKPLTEGDVERVEVRVNGKTRALVDNPAPKDIFPAIVSGQHWIALALLGESLGIEGLYQEIIDKPAVAALRRKITLVTDDSLPVTDCVITIHVRGKPPIVLDGRGADASNISLSDEVLVQKYLDQGKLVLQDDRLHDLLDLIMKIEQSADFGQDLGRIFPMAA
ncbi:MmgE/PrpD family protein [Castellaniella denitrificans]|jgi:2-methylcitrate dehydratase PrpD|uniref:MmgE/PrpD family protein n=1 Tax=Castellaniella denitrificans TaxID=56119 RepID=UPI00361D02B3